MLVRIALVYFFTSLIVLNVPLRGQVVLGVVILLGYWATLAFLPNPHDYWSNLSNDGNVRSSSTARSLATSTCTTAIRPPSPKVS